VALADLEDADLDRVGHRQLLSRAWQLRANLTVCDAAYVALAEALRCPLVTADARLARSPGPRCPIEVVRPG
jgi:predicted nucleic acid-binding protein